MKPKIKKYLSVHQYLQDFYLFRKEEGLHFSYDVWAKELGVNDKSYIRLMVFGKRPINARMTAAFLENLGLSADDQEYFAILVQYTQSKTREQKEAFGKKLISLLKNDTDRLEIQAHHDFLSDPFLPRLQVLLSFQDLQASPAQVAWLLGITEDVVMASLAKLEDLRLIEKTESGYRPLKKSFKVPDQFGDLGLENFYKKNLEDAQEAMNLPKDERRFKSLFLPLNKEEFNEYLNALQVFVNEQLFKFNRDEYADRRLYQVHFHAFPVSARNEGKAPGLRAGIGADVDNV